MKAKSWLILAIFLILAGSVVFIGVMTSLNWDFTKFSTVEYETNEYTLTENFQNISVITNTADVAIVPSEDITARVVCYEQTDIRHTVTVQDGTLTIQAQDERDWYKHIGIFPDAPKVTIYLPHYSLASSIAPEKIPDELLNPEYIYTIQVVPRPAVKAGVGGTIRIQNSTGNIHIRNIAATGFDLSLSTGKVLMNDVACNGDINVKLTTGKTELTRIRSKNLISEGSTGDLSLTNVIATEKFSLQRSTGDIEFENCEAPEILAKTSTGDIEGSLLVDKVFITHSSTGDIDVPDSTTGGRCELSTSTGDIEISVN